MKDEKVLEIIEELNKVTIHGFNLGELLSRQQQMFENIDNQFGEFNKGCYGYIVNNEKVTHYILGGLVERFFNDDKWLIDQGIGEEEPFVFAMVEAARNRLDIVHVMELLKKIKKMGIPVSEAEEMFEEVAAFTNQKIIDVRTDFILDFASKVTGEKYITTRLNKKSSY